MPAEERRERASRSAAIERGEENLTVPPTADQLAPYEEPGLSTQTVKSFGWAAVSFGGNRFVVFAATLVLARLLTPEDFGVVAAAIALLTYFEVGLDVGAGAALIHDQEHGITHRVQVAFTLNLMVATALTVAVAALAPVIADLFGVGGDADVFRAMSLLLLLRGAGQVPDAVFRRDLAFKRRTVVEIVRAAVRFLVSVTLAFAGFGVWSLVWGLLAGAATGSALSWAMLGFFPDLSWNRREARYLLSFGATTTGARILTALGTNADYLAVGTRLGATALGFYSIAYRIPELIAGNVFHMISSVAYPAYSKAQARSNEVLQDGMLRALGLTTLFGFAAGTALAVASRDLIIVAFGAKWAPSITPMALIAIAAGISSIGFASGDVFPAIGRPRVLLNMNLVFMPLLVVAVFVAAGWGIVAVAVAHLVFNLAYVWARLWLAERHIGVTILQSIGAMRPGFVASAGIVAAALPVRLATDAGAASLVLVGGAGALGAFLALWIAARDTFGVLGGLFRRLVRSPGP